MVRLEYMIVLACLNFGVFQELQDKHYFKQAKISGGTVVWPHEQDICPDTLYLDSVKEFA